MPIDYLPILMFFVIATAIACAILWLARTMGPKNPTAIKSEAFECGSPSSGDARDPLSVKYYVTAILFLVFDIEAVFVYPWAILYRKLGLAGLIEMVIFMSFLLVGLIYVVRKGALEWE